MIAFVVTTLCVLAIFIYYKVSNTYTYWSKKKVKGSEPKLFYGNFKTLLTKEDSVTSLMEQFYKQYPNEKIVGLYQGLTPTLLLRDPDIIKRVLIKDFGIFCDRGFRINNAPLTKNLFSLDGNDWKILRTKLTPLFSTGKLKQMMPLMNNCVKLYVQYLDKIVDQQVPQEIRDLNMKYTLKTITSVAFGIDIETFTDEKTEFIQMATELFAPQGFSRRLAMFIDSLFPGIFKVLPITLTRKEIYDFFLGLVNRIIKEREGKPKTRKDFMDLMIELKEQGAVTRSGDEDGAELEITDEIIAAQALLFYAAGFETSSGSMSFLLYELAFNQTAQDRCFEEIQRIMGKYNGELSYEALNELEYVSMAFDEALRKHPVAGVLLRQCVTNYEIPELNFTLEKGTKVFIPAIGLHLDSQYFPEPEKFDPERFSMANKSSIHGGTYLPFGDGPRNCIGLRFAKVQSMLGIAHILYNFRVTPTETTPKKLKYDPCVIVLKSIDGIWLNIERRS